MALITLRDIELGYGGPNLLDRLSLTIEAGERIALVGRNGSGKSTLLKLIDGQILPDAGSVERGSGLRVGYLAQQEADGPYDTAFDFVAAGAGATAGLLSRYHLLCQSENPCAETLAQLQHDIDAADGWALDRNVSQLLTEVGLAADLRFDKLSGGQRRRAALAQALLDEPQLLVLDEPTNHLDIAAIDQLEQLLLRCGKTLLFISHDRRFAAALATRVIELDRGQLSSWPGDWQNFLRRREEALNAEAQEGARLNKKRQQEEAWARQGVKARRKRNQGRVRALQALRKQMAARRQQLGTTRAGAQEAERSGKRVLVAEHLRFAYQTQPLVEDFSCLVERGDKIGLIGPNGAGKTTLLKLLLGELTPDEGTLDHGTRLQIAYFDQGRHQLDGNQRVQDAVADGSDTVELNGQHRHVLSYLADFLFTPERARSPVSSLSGGEHNRLLLARILAKPSNLLILDEPTNDLDVETLEVLEDVLVEYSGTVLLISHDREFVDNVVGSIWVFEGAGRISEHIGGYSDWAQRQATEKTAQSNTGGKNGVARKPSGTAKKLSYKDQRELSKLPAKIEGLEGEVEQLHTTLADPATYQQDSDISELQKQLAELEDALAKHYARWEALEAARDQLEAKP